MCNITRLHCEVCQASSRHLFLPCDDFLSEQVRDKNGAVINHIEPGKRFCCNELKWPLDPDEDNSHWVCNTCLEFGRKSYKNSVEVFKRLKDGNISQSHYVSLLRGHLPDSHVDNILLAEPELEHLPMEFSNVAETTRENLISLYNSPDLPDSLWEDRTASSDGCYLTIWMPCCPVCKDPMVDPARGGIVAIEFEPTSELWRWMAVNQRLVPHEVQAFQITIATGFIGKVCEICVNMEIVLRQQVKTYLQDTTRPRTWAVLTWLFHRGMLGRPFYDYAVPNLGFPDTKPPTDKEIMGLMTRSWERLANGLTFGDCIVDSGPPVAYSAPLNRHQEPLMRLDQWVRLVEPQSNKRLNINSPPLPLNLMASDPSVACLISNMSVDNQSGIDHGLDTGAGDDGNKGHKAFKNAYIDRADASPAEEIDDGNDNDSVSSGTSYTSYETPVSDPEFHFLPDKPRSYIMTKRIFHSSFAFLINDDMTAPCTMSTTYMLERIALGSIDAIIALWHMLGEFIKTMRRGNAKRHYGHLESEWKETHEYLGIVAKFAAAVRENPKKRYKNESLLTGRLQPRNLDKVVDTLLDKVGRKSGRSSEPGWSDISELPIEVVSTTHRPITEGLLDLYMPEISYSEGDGGSVVATVRGVAVCGGTWTTQRYHIPESFRKVHVWKFTGPDFEESFAAAATEGLFVGVMRRSLFGENKPGLLAGEHSARKDSALESEQKKPSQKKHVRFAPSPVHEASQSKPWWKIGHNSADGDDASMADADDSDVIDLDDGHGSFILCDKGGWHYSDKFGSPMGEQISLPGLGLELGD